MKQSVLDTFHKSGLDAEYEVLGVLGSGGFGTVYKVVQKSMSRLIALKLIRLDDGLSNSERILQRFLREAQLLSHLDHPNIVKVFRFGRTSETGAYLAMEFVDGEPLSRRIESGKPFSPAELRSLLTQGASALSVLHDNNMVHRDIKPDNILLTRTQDGKDQLKLVDFGLSKSATADSLQSQQQITRAGETVGTPLYMSPEQCRGIQADVRSDIYSLGLVMYEAFTGVPAFLADSATALMLLQVTEAPPEMSAKRPDLADDYPKHLEQVILRCLAKEPSDRFATPRELLEYLEFDLPCTSSASLSNTGTGTKSWGIGTLPVVSMVVLLCVVLAGSSAYFFNHRNAGTNHNNAAQAATSRVLYMRAVSIRLPEDVATAKVNEAASIYKSALTANKTDGLLSKDEESSALGVLAQLLMWTKQYKEAQDYTVQALMFDNAHDIEPAIGLIRAASLCSRVAGGRKRAISLLRESVSKLSRERNRNYAQALYMLVVLYVGNGRAAEAAQLLAQEKCSPDESANPNASKLADGLVKLYCGQSQAALEELHGVAPVDGLAYDIDDPVGLVMRLNLAVDNMAEVRRFAKDDYIGKPGKLGAQESILWQAKLKHWSDAARCLQDVARKDYQYAYYSGYADWDIHELARLAAEDGQKILSQTALNLADKKRAEYRLLEP